MMEKGIVQDFAREGKCYVGVKSENTFKTLSEFCCINRKKLAFNLFYAKGEELEFLNFQESLPGREWKL